MSVHYVRLKMPIRYVRPETMVSQWFGVNPENYNGWGHEGIDFALPQGTPVYAACAGEVHRVMESRVYGLYVRLLSKGWLQTHDGSRQVEGIWKTVYAHLSVILVRPGELVTAGQIIGRSGNTGRSTGPHLHFGLRLPGQKATDRHWGYADPAPWLGLDKERLQ